MGGAMKIFTFAEYLVVNYKEYLFIRVVIEAKSDERIFSFINKSKKMFKIPYQTLCNKFYAKDEVLLHNKITKTNKKCFFPLVQNAD